MEKTLELINQKMHESSLEKLFKERMEIDNQLEEIIHWQAANEDEYNTLRRRKENNREYLFDRFNELVNLFNEKDRERESLENKLHSTEPIIVSFLNGFKEELTNTVLIEFKNYKADKEKFRQEFELLLSDINREEIIFKVLDDVLRQLPNDFIDEFLLNIVVSEELNEFFGGSDYLFERLVEKERN